MVKENTAVITGNNSVQLFKRLSLVRKHYIRISFSSAIADSVDIRYQVFLSSDWSAREM